MQSNPKLNMTFDSYGIKVRYGSLVRKIAWAHVVTFTQEYKELIIATRNTAHVYHCIDAGRALSLFEEMDKASMEYSVVNVDARVM